MAMICAVAGVLGAVRAGHDMRRRWCQRRTVAVNLPITSRSMVDTQLTRPAYERLQQELFERSGPRRRQIADWIERARELGDLRENGDYHAAKNEQCLN